MEVTTLKREVENILEKDNIIELVEDNVSTRKLIKRKPLNFDGDLLPIIEETISQNAPTYGISMQVLPAKEIQAILQSQFKFFNFQVKDVEVETSKRITVNFAPYNYAMKPNNEDINTFLEDLQKQEDIVFKENAKVIRWANKKVSVKLKEESELYSEDKEYLVGNTVKAIKINIKGLDGKDITDRPIFTIPGVSISKQMSQKLYRNFAIGGNIPSIGEYKSKDYAEDNLYKIMDLNYLIGLCKMLEMCVEFIDKDPSFLYNKDYSYYDRNYSTEDMFKLLDLRYLTKHKEVINKDIMFLICECIISATHIKNDELLIRKYRRDIAAEYSKSFETKKNIPDKIKMAMKNNGFLENFTYIELDELIDIDKFYLIENEFLSMKECSNLGKYLKSNAELRFKRLGQHRTAGLYYPEHKCICVDINNPQSFMNGVAHHIDYTIGENPASTSVDFRMLSISYKRELEYTLLKEEDIRIANYYKRKRDYFHTPTEIFARCFEIYLVSIKKVKSSLLPNESFFLLKNGYPELNESLLNKIKRYFENIFEITEDIDTTATRNKQISIENVEINNLDIIQSTQTKVDIRSQNKENLDTLKNKLETTNNEPIVGMVYENDYFLKLIEESIASIDLTDKPRKRRRKTNRSAIANEYGTQLSFL